VKRSVLVELMEEHAGANFYSIRFADETDSLFEQFITKFDTPRFKEDVDSIVYWLDKIGERGALERHFRNEGHPNVKAIPIPPPSSKLRLYCFRLSDEILVFGGGDIKQTRTYQEDPVLTRHVKIVRAVGTTIQQRISIGTTTNVARELYGQLDFKINI
jgi:hypothetical protein